MFVILLFSLIYNNYLRPAYWSTAINCKLLDKDEQNIKNLSIAGETIIFTNETEKKINIRIISNDKNTIRHELCHVRQEQQNRLFGCNLLILNYANEIECYVSEDIPFLFDSRIVDEIKLKTENGTNVFNEFK